MKRLKTVIAVSMLLTFSIAAQATVLAPGAQTSTVNDQVTVGTVGPTLSTHYLATAGTATLSGYLTSWVANDAKNPFGSGALSFYYLINNGGPAATEAVARIALVGFGGFQVDVERIDGFSPSAVAPTSADRSLSGNGNLVGFDFNTPIQVGQLGDVLVVHTDAHAYRTGFANVSDTANALGVAIYAPAVVPEPATLLAGALLLVPFAGSTLRILRKR